MTPATIARHATTLTRAYAAYLDARATHEVEAAALAKLAAKKRLTKKQRAEMQAAADAERAANDGGLRDEQ